MRKFSKFVSAFAFVAFASGVAMAQSEKKEESKDPWESKFHTLKDGTKLHYVEMGKGPAVILIHGAGGSAAGNWFKNGIAPALAPTNRVIGIDMRGHGLTTTPPGATGGNMAADVLEFMKDMKIEKAHIGGYSMGGGVTSSLMRTNPEKFITAHLGGSGITETAEWRDKVPPDLTGEVEAEAKAREGYNQARAERGEEVGNNPAALRGRRGAAGARAGAAGAAAAGAAAATEGAAAVGAAANQARGAAGAAAGAARGAAGAAAGRAGRGGAAAATPIDLSKINFPILAVNGDHDRPNAKTHRLWREGKNFTNVVLKDRGHLSAVMQQTIPKEYIDSMVAFITSNNPK